MPTLSPAAWDDPVVRQLTTAQQAELRARHGEGSREPGGCGALRPLGPGVAELERTYVVPAGAFAPHPGAEEDTSLFLRREPAEEA